MSRFGAREVKIFGPFWGRLSPCTLIIAPNRGDVKWFLEIFWKKVAIWVIEGQKEAQTSRSAPFSRYLGCWTARSPKLNV